jgi:hypothetical protein
MMLRVAPLLAAAAVMACASTPAPAVDIPTDLGGVVNCAIHVADASGYRTTSEEALPFQADAVVRAVKSGPEGQRGLVAFVRWGATPEERTIAFMPLPRGSLTFDPRSNALRRRIERTCLGR